MGAELRWTHHLACERFADECRALVGLILADTTTATVWLREAEMETPPPDAENCRRTWTAVRDRFERVPESDRNGTTAWRVPTTTDSGREALLELLALTDGGAGAYFVYKFALADGEAPVLEAVPHHLDARIDATQVGSVIESGEIVGLSGHQACLVPAETHFEWVAEDRRWKRRGGSLCVETLDGRKATCHGLRNLERATIEEGTVLALAWEPGELPDNGIGRLLSWIVDKLSNPSPAVPCETPERARAVKALLAELLAAYDGREI